MANQILQIAANGSGPSSNKLPWWLRLPVHIAGGALVGVVILAAVAFMYFIAHRHG
jgi:hypothetical protein